MKMPRALQSHVLRYFVLVLACFENSRARSQARMVVVGVLIDGCWSLRESDWIAWALDLAIDQRVRRE